MWQSDLAILHKPYSSLPSTVTASYHSTRLWGLRWRMASVRCLHAPSRHRCSIDTTACIHKILQLQGTPAGGGCAASQVTVSSSLLS